MPSSRRVTTLNHAALFAIALFLSLALALLAAPAAPAPFDRSVKAVRPGLVGNDFMAIFNARQIKPKGEYETTDQYEKRVAALAGEDFAFRLGPPQMKYDADKGAFVVYLREEPPYLSGVLEYPTRDKFSIIVGSKDVTQGHYIGSNAMGAKVRVAKDTETTLAITVKGDSQALIRHPLLVPVEPSVARKVKAFLGFLCVGRLDTSDPEVAKTVVIHIDPGIDHPLERTLIYHYLASEQVEVWTYNKATGKVLQKNVIDSHGYGEAQGALAPRGEAAQTPPAPNSERTAPTASPQKPPPAATITAADAGPPSALSAEPATVAPTESPGFRRVAVAGTSMGFPYTVEIPSDWQVHERGFPKPMIWLAPPAVMNPDLDPDTIGVHACQVSLANPEQVASNLRRSLKGVKTVVVKEIDGIRGVLSEWDQGASTVLGLMLPTSTGCVQLLALSPLAEFAAHRANYERIIFSVRRAP